MKLGASRFRFDLRKGLMIAAFLLPDVNALSAQISEITRYQAVNLDCHIISTGEAVRAFRSFDYGPQKMNLIVHLETFQTGMIETTQLACGPHFALEIKSSRFGRALSLASPLPPPSPTVFYNRGIRHADKTVSGLFLTADLCPAVHEKFEERFFLALKQIAQARNEPVPIGLSISGHWLRAHEADFYKIQTYVKQKILNVTWINHTETHPYIVGLPENENFVLLPGVRPGLEILGVELELLKRHELPSVFFRFPGLISNPDWMHRLMHYSLIAVGSDAWLAKNEFPAAGSIILVHANGNEPEGITLFLKWLFITRPDPQAFLPLDQLF